MFFEWTLAIKVRINTKSPSPQERISQLKALIKDYTSVGGPASDRNAADSAVDIWRALYEEQHLNVRVFVQ